MNKLNWLFMVFVAVCLVSFSTPAQADKHKLRLSGTVESVDVPNNAFVIMEQNGTKTRIAVDARSDFEVEPQDRSKHDYNVPFTELKVGDKIKVKAYPPLQQGLPLADDVEIYR